MSYCRWSSDDGQCDVYVYEDVAGGWTTHVASRRIKHIPPDHVRKLCRSWPFADDPAAEYEKYEQERQEWIMSFPHEMYQVRAVGGAFIEMPAFAESEYIDLSEISHHAGRSYNHSTPENCVACLLDIRASGLNVPQYAIDELMEEYSEAANKLQTS